MKIDGQQPISSTDEISTKPAHHHRKFEKYTAPEHHQHHHQNCRSPECRVQMGSTISCAGDNG
ncbi:hypothetical protein, partial [Acinetobacter baumannii]|uniref:hypothetical protein n=1 Tax=Acinetobacter baumannii TaxID=470 RepID=UPI001488A27A